MKSVFLKKIIYKSQYLELEEEELRETLPPLRARFLQDLANYCASLNLPYETEEEPSQPPPKPPLSPESFNKPEVKTLFNKSALLTHPDKYPNDPEKALQFKDIAAAKECGDLIKLIALALDLGLHKEVEAVAHLTEDYFEKKEKKIKNLKKDVAFVYSRLNKEEQEIFIKNLIK